MSIFIRKFISLNFFIVFFLPSLLSDSFNYNQYNNHGVIGLINTPTARFYDSESFGFTVYKGDPDEKIIISASPYDWLEASLFYVNINDNPLGCNFTTCYKDKGFSFKIRLKEEGAMPAVAVGINDLGGTGLYNSEYIVSSYGVDNLDFHFGLGWGALNGYDEYKNPLGYLYDGFNSRPERTDEGLGGNIALNNFFSGKFTKFYGISYAYNKNILIKLERDTTRQNERINYKLPNSEISLGIDYLVNDNFTIGLAKERGNNLSLRFIYKKNPEPILKKSTFKPVERIQGDSNYTTLIRSLESNGIGVNRIVESADKIGIEITQFQHPTLEIINEIILGSKNSSDIKKEIKVDYRTLDMQVQSDFTEDLEQSPSLIYERKKIRKFNNNISFNLRPFLAAREGFFKLAFLAENNTEYIIKDNLIFSANLKYSIADNYKDLTYPPEDTYPAQVRSDIKDYLQNFNERVIIGRAQVDYYATPKKNNHLMLSSGILEEMFAGYGLEYLYYDNSKNYAYGFEIFDVRKRDYNLRFGTTDYTNVTGHLNFYYRNYLFFPFDSKFSYGEYLAGDKGFTFEISRTYQNGAKLGFFASFTDVSRDQFGEGSFDKGIMFNVPIYKNIINYTWRPLTKDPGAKLLRKNSLHDLLIKFKPYNP